MLHRRLATAVVPCLAGALLASTVTTVSASDRDRKFFESVQGEWSGPGEIVAGKYKGTRFICNFTGSSPNDGVGMSLDGGCRVGMFTQKMSAKIRRGGRGYSGTFLDGSKGEGLDIVSGSVTNGKAVFSLHRKSLKGAMLARLPDGETMNVTVSVRVASEMVPVIGMSLKRVDSKTVGSVQTR